VVERQPEGGGALREVGVVRDHHRRAPFQLALLEAPEEVEQTVVVAGDEDRDALVGVLARKPPVHLETVGELAELRGRVLPELGLDAKEETVPG
jgi:hypothetical protein